MKQTIKFLRGASTYANYNAAIDALNGLTHVVGQPVVALYTKTVTEDPLVTETKLILAVGKAASTGATSYEILATNADLQELINVVGDLSAELTTHEAVLAGTDSGHAKSGTQITFTDGVATINANQVTLSNLQKIAKGTILGVASDASEETDTPAALTASEVRTILNVADGAEVNQNAFSHIYTDNGEIIAGRPEDHFRITGRGGIYTENNGDDSVIIDIEDNGIYLNKLAKGAKGGFLGIATGNGSGTDDVTVISNADVLTQLGIQNGYKTVTVGDTSLAADSLGDEIEFKAGTNITLTPTAADSGAPASVTVSFNGFNAALIGAPTAPTQNLADASDSSKKYEIATLEYVKNAIDDSMVAAQAMEFKGVANSASDLSADALPGWTYRAGTEFTLNGEVVEVGDMIICTAKATTSPDAPAQWAVIQANIDGAVTGPASSVSGNIATYDGATGKVIQDSGIAASSVVLNSRTVTATNGLELDSSNSTGALSSNVIIKHSAASSTIGNDSIVTGVTVDAYGHIDTVTTGDLSVDVSGAGEGKYISSAAVDSADPLKINYTFATLPSETGKVRVDSAGTADYLDQKVLSGSNDQSDNNNIYGVTVTKNADALYLTVAIDEIDGGTF